MEKMTFIMLKKVHIYMLLQLNHCWEQTRLFPSPFYVSTSSRLTLAGAFRSEYVAA